MKNNKIYLNEENLYSEDPSPPIASFLISVLWSFSFTLPFWITLLYSFAVYGDQALEEVRVTLYFVITSLLVLVPAIYEKEEEKKS